MPWSELSDMSLYAQVLNKSANRFEISGINFFKDLVIILVPNKKDIELRSPVFDGYFVFNMQEVRMIVSGYIEKTPGIFIYETYKVWSED